MYAYVSMYISAEQSGDYFLKCQIRLLLKHVVFIRAV